MAENPEGPLTSIDESAGVPVHYLNLEQFWPELSRDEEAVPCGVVSDAIEHRLGVEAISGGHQPAQVDPAGDIAGVGAIIAIRSVCQTFA